MSRLGPAFSIADHLAHDRVPLNALEQQAVAEVDAVLMGTDVGAVFTRVVPVAPYLYAHWPICRYALSWRFRSRLSLRELDSAVQEARAQRRRSIPEK